MADLYDSERLSGLVANRLAELNAILVANSDAPYTDAEVEEIVSSYRAMGERLKGYVGNVGSTLDAAMKDGVPILFEGAQGALLDIDHGTYPYVTSSNTVGSNAATGTGLGPSALGHIVGITKAYTTRVGSGPFPTELHDGAGDQLRAVGREFGATTGRPRRCGWMDLVALRYSARLSGFHSVAITKLDVLADIDPLRVCTHYELDGERLETFPDNAADLMRVVPVYEDLKGFGDVSSAQPRGPPSGGARVPRQNRGCPRRRRCAGVGRPRPGRGHRGHQPLRRVMRSVA